MSEFDSIKIHNPLDVDFTQNFNGESYLLKANETKDLAKFVAFHLAKHLSDKIIKEDHNKMVSPKKKNWTVAQIMNYDNPFRRIALHKILGSREQIEKCLFQYNFKSFIGEMSDYENFVTSANEKIAKEEKVKKPKEESVTA
jgi:hypothetical protein